MLFFFRFSASSLYCLDDLFYPDFYLPEHNIILEVQGDYWHSNPRFYGEGKKPLDERQKKDQKRDRRKFGYYKHKKIKYYELWGYDLKNDLENTMLDNFKISKTTLFEEIKPLELAYKLLNEKIGYDASTGTGDNI